MSSAFPPSPARFAVLTFLALCTAAGAYAEGPPTLTTGLPRSAATAWRTGWEAAEARGKKLQEVFNILNEATREPLESPVTRAIRETLMPSDAA